MMGNYIDDNVKTLTKLDVVTHGPLTTVQTWISFTLPMYQYIYFLHFKYLLIKHPKKVYVAEIVCGPQTFLVIAREKKIATSD